MDKREGTATSKEKPQLETKVRCFSQVFQPEGYPFITADGRRVLAPAGYTIKRYDGYGNCCTCEYDPEKNRHCKGYRPMGFTLHTFEVRDPNDARSPRQVFLDGFYNSTAKGDLREMLAMCCEKLGIGMPPTENNEELRAQHIVLEARLVRQYGPRG